MKDHAGVERTSRNDSRITTAQTGTQAHYDRRSLQNSDYFLIDNKLIIDLLSIKFCRLCPQFVRISRETENNRYF